MGALQAVWEFFQKQVLGMGWLNALFGSILSSIGCRLGYTVESIGDNVEIARYGVMRTPAVVVDEKVISYGRFLNQKDAEALLKKHLGL